MRRYALLGSHVDESLSPALHECAFSALNQKAIYELWPCQVEDFDVHIGRARAQLDGFNLTAPFKQAILPHLDSISARAKALQSVNTVRVAAGQLHGENTDLEGLEVSLQQLGLDGGSAMVLGAGGVIGAVMQALANAGVSSLSLCARQTPQALAWAQHCPINVEVVPWCERQAQAGRHQLVVQATPLGAKGSDQAPLYFAPSDDHGVLDLVYRRQGTTPLIVAARAAGLRCLDGRTMLKEQAVATQRVWGFGIEGAQAMRHFFVDE